LIELFSEIYKFFTSNNIENILKGWHTLDSDH